MRFLKLLFPLVLLLLCVGVNQALAQTAMQVAFAVMDSRQSPLPGIAMAVEPLSGQALDGASLSSNPQGQISFEWLPALQESNLDSEDKLVSYVAAFNWRVHAPGFLPEAGQIASQKPLRQLQAQELHSLNTTPSFSPVRQSIVLHALPELFGAGLAHGQQPIKEWCKDFYEKNYLVARQLGAAFDWPGFDMQGQTLVLSLQFSDQGWGGAAQGSLLARAVFNSYLPWCLLLSGSVDSLPQQVQAVKLVFTSRLQAGTSDPHALSKNIVLAATVPVAALREYAARPDSIAYHYPLQQQP